MNGRATPANQANRGLVTSRERRQHNVSAGIRVPATLAAQKLAAATIAVATGPTNTAIIDKRAAVMSCRTTPKNSPVATVRTSRSAPFVHHNKGKYQARDLANCRRSSLPPTGTATSATASSARHSASFSTRRRLARKP